MKKDRKGKLVERFPTRSSDALQIAFSLIPGFFWVIFSWPARLSGDSLSVLGDIKFGIQNDWHTLLYRDFVFLTSLGSNYPEFTSIIQVTLLTFSIFYLCRSLWPDGKKPLITTFLIMATPYGGGIATTLWKDVLFCILSIASISILIQLQRNNQKIQIKVLISFSLITLITLSRHEAGFLLLIGGLYYVFLSIIAGKKSQLYFATLVIISAIIAMVLSDVSVSFRNATPVPNYVKYASFASDLAYVSSVRPGENKSLDEFVSKFSTSDSFKNASYCGTISGFFYSDGFNGEFVGQNYVTVFKHWFASWIFEPGLMLKHRMCTAAPFTPYPLSSGPSYSYLLHPGIDTNTLGYEFRPVKFDSLVISNIANSVFSLFLALFWPGLILTFAFMFYLFVKIRYSETKLLWFQKLSIEISFFQSLLLFFFSGAQDFRYMTFSVVLLLISLVSSVVAILSTRNRETSSTLIE